MEEKYAIIKVNAKIYQDFQDANKNFFFLYPKKRRKRFKYSLMGGYGIRYFSKEEINTSIFSVFSTLEVYSLFYQFLITLFSSRPPRWYTYLKWYLWKPYEFGYE